MANYQIKHFDPLKPPFEVVDYTINGPGTTPSESSVYVHGRGYLDWGENVDENFLRLLENFAGSTAPLNPIEGQIWYRTSLYIHNTTANTWFKWNHLAETWVSMTPSEIIESSTEPARSEGIHWFNDTTGVLSMWSSSYTAAGLPLWVERNYTQFTANPTTEKPATFVFAWDGIRWTSISGVITQTSTPTGAQIGQLWYDPSTQKMYLFDDSITPIWTPLLLSNGYSSLLGDFNAGNNTIKNVLVDDTDPTSAATRAYTDTFVGNSLQQGLGQSLLDHINDTAVHLTPSQNLWLDALVATADELNDLIGIRGNVQDQLNNLAAANAASVANKVDTAGDTMVGNLTVSHTPVNDHHAATKQYIDQLRNVSGLNDVALPNSAITNNGFVTGDILKYNSSNQMWEIVAGLGTIRLSASYPTLAGSLNPGESATISTFIVNSDGTETDVSTDVGTTYSILSGSGTFSPTQKNLFTGPTSNNQSSTTIRVMNGALQRTTTIVTQPTILVDSVNLFGNTTFNHGDTTNISATATLSNDDVWYSTNADQASTFVWKLDGDIIPNSSFVVPTSLLPGNHTISVTFATAWDSQIVSETISIIAIPTTLTIVGDLTALTIPTTRTFSATVMMSDGSSRTVVAMWHITNGPGTISSGGVYTPPTFIPSSTSVSIRARYAEAGVLVTSPTVTFTLMPAV